MKTRSHLQTLGIGNHSPQGRSAAWQTRGRSLHGVFLIALTLVSGAVLAAPPDFCQQAAQDAARSCAEGARSVYARAAGKCDNIADPAASAACQKQAAVDYKDAQTLCGQQNVLRLGVCQRLGGGTYEPVIDPANFVTTIDNPYFPLTPGTTFVYEGQTSDGFEHVEFAVTHDTKVILGVTCVEIHDSRFIDGVLLEDTRDWFAQDKAGNVWYFGENTTLVDGGLPVNLGGTWTAGVDGAQPGFVMKAQPPVGDFYRQEFSLRNAEDLAEVKSLNVSVTVPYGTFQHCRKTLESSPLAPGDLENKFYAAGVGNLLTIDLATGERSELVAIITE